MIRYSIHVSTMYSHSDKYTYAGSRNAVLISAPSKQSPSHLESVEKICLVSHTSTSSTPFAT
jgi:hypothetical protein